MTSTQSSVWSQFPERGEQESSLIAKGDRHEHREQRREAFNRSHRCSNVHKCQWTEVEELRERQSIKRWRDWEVYFRVVKQRQSSNTVECPQVPFIERSSTPRSSSSTHVECCVRMWIRRIWARWLSTFSRCSRVEMEVLRQDGVATWVQTTRFRSWFVQPKWLTTRTSWRFPNDALVKAEAQFNK